MRFELNPEKSLKQNLRRLLAKQNDKAASALRGEMNLQDDAIVHEVRKRFKRIRAMARLGREALGEERAGEINSWFRDAGRSLSEMRDAGVLIHTINNLADEWTDEDRPEAFEPLRVLLNSRREEAARRWIDERDVFASVGEQLEKSGHLLKSLDVDRHGWERLAEGLSRSYERCFRAWLKARDRPDVDTLHGWRKRVKDLFYQSQVAATVRPGYFARMETEADSLADLLGEDHDLAVLRQVIEEEPALNGSDAVLLTLDRRRVELQASAFAQAPALLSESAEDFAARMSAYVKAWRAEVQAAAFEKPPVS